MQDTHERADEITAITDPRAFDARSLQGTHVLVAQQHDTDAPTTIVGNHAETIGARASVARGSGRRVPQHVPATRRCQQNAFDEAAASYKDRERQREQQKQVPASG
jgi:hypothetical protein